MKKRQKGGTATSFNKPKDKKKEEIMVVTSFNDWMPTKLKTLRTLHLEKYNPELENPKSLYRLDNTMQIYANYAPPGQHFFYFTKEGGEIFLSPKYEIIRFKKTNIYLNRIIVKARQENEEIEVTTAKENVEEAVFMKDRSVFKDFRDDSVPFLKKCLEQDMEHSKLPRLFKKSPEEYAAVKECLFNNYEQIVNIFTFYVGMSSYPTISMNDATAFAH